VKHELRTEIDIDAAPAVVWRVLTDLPHYSDWNPFIVSSHGRVAVGQRLTNRLRPAGATERTFKPTVTVVDPPRTLEWLGHLGFRGLCDGRHRFELTGDGHRHSPCPDRALQRSARPVRAPFARQRHRGRFRQHEPCAQGSG
jgi:hypothetical protein